LAHANNELYLRLHVFYQLTFANILNKIKALLV